jgi:hypothetical protein
MPNMMLNLAILSVIKLKHVLIVSFPSQNLLRINIKTGLMGRFRYLLPNDLTIRMDR